ncbi:MAG: gamma-glutamylcyclotransferase [Lachnospiraceae bacterium]|nr:gamma-glutamylcyclotransferase [Lachnospiraceae bacterium]
MDFFRKTACDRCNGSLSDGRIQSMYNSDCICMACKEKETQRADYKEALEADRAEIKRGNYNYAGIGLN